MHHFLYILGGPLTHYNPANSVFTQLGIVSGGIGECGDKRFPGIYVRLSHPEIFSFIESVVKLSNGAGEKLIDSFLASGSHF